MQAKETPKYRRGAEAWAEAFERMDEVLARRGKSVICPFKDLGHGRCVPEVVIHKAPTSGDAST